jgi:hypothetical protein
MQKGSFNVLLFMSQKVKLKNYEKFSKYASKVVMQFEMHNL